MSILLEYVQLASHIWLVIYIVNGALYRCHQHRSKTPNSSGWFAIILQTTLSLVVLGELRSLGRKFKAYGVCAPRLGAALANHWRLGG